MMNVPLRWPRITTRRLMALVALVALAFGAELTRRRGEAYAEKAALHAKQERHCRDLVDFQDDYVARLKRLADWEEAERAKADYQRNPEWTPESLRKTATMYVEEAKYTREHVDFYEKLKAKYQHAAQYPWLPVQPDPPMPSRNR